MLEKTKPQIDFDSPVPYWSQLRDILIRQIEDEFSPGDRLPTNQHLCEQFGVSRTTVRQALDRLENDGLIRRRKGSGTFVAEPALSEGLQWTLSHFAHEGSDGEAIQHSIVRRIEVVDADIGLLERMELSEPCKVVALERLRVIEGTVRSVSHCYLPSHLVPGLEKLDFRNRSLYRTLREDFGLELQSSKREISATVATDEQAGLLGIAPNEALLVVESHSYLPDGELIEYFKAYHLADHTRFNVVLNSTQIS